MKNLLEFGLGLHVNAISIVGRKAPRHEVVDDLQLVENSSGLARTEAEQESQFFRDHMKKNSPLQYTLCDIK